MLFDGNLLNNRIADLEAQAFKSATFVYRHIYVNPNVPLTIPIADPYEFLFNENLGNNSDFQLVGGKIRTTKALKNVIVDFNGDFGMLVAISEMRVVVGTTLIKQDRGTIQAYFAKIPTNTIISVVGVILASITKSSYSVKITYQS